MLKKYTGHAAHVTVPAQAHGKPVVEIADYAFANHEQLQRVSLPACVEDIGNHVFTTVTHWNSCIWRTAYALSETVHLKIAEICTRFP